MTANIGESRYLLRPEKPREFVKVDVRHEFIFVGDEFESVTFRSDTFAELVFRWTNRQSGYSQDTDAPSFRYVL